MYEVRAFVPSDGKSKKLSNIQNLYNTSFCQRMENKKINTANATMES